MSDAILDNEEFIRLGFFFGVFAVMALWEIASPRRELSMSKQVRWVSNLVIATLNTFILRLLFPAAAVGIALVAQERGWGLLNNVDYPVWLKIATTVVFMDFAIYLQHALFHAVPGLWRLHRVHHTDLDYDVTTGIRFHPIEIILSMLIKISVVVTIGAPAIAVLIFEVMLNTTAMFNHSNVYIPSMLDKIIRLLIVTPDMHRIHHSTEDHETNSNFGFSLSIWDRFFGTYLDQPEKGHEGMEIGIRSFREPRQNTLGWMLVIPFIGKVTGYVINRRKFD